MKGWSGCNEMAREAVCLGPYASTKYFIPFSELCLYSISLSISVRVTCSVSQFWYGFALRLWRSRAMNVGFLQVWKASIVSGIPGQV